jgi:hypothetical protein
MRRTSGVVTRCSRDLHCLAKFEFCAGNLNLTTLRMMEISAACIEQLRPLTHRKPSREDHASLLLHWLAAPAIVP